MGLAGPLGPFGGRLVGPDHRDGRAAAHHSDFHGAHTARHGLRAAPGGTSKFVARHLKGELTRFHSFSLLKSIESILFSLRLQFILAFLVVFSLQRTCRSLCWATAAETCAASWKPRRCVGAFGSDFFLGFTLCTSLITLSNFTLSDFLTVSDFFR